MQSLETLTTKLLIQVHFLNFTWARYVLCSHFVLCVPISIIIWDSDKWLAYSWGHRCVPRLCLTKVTRRPGACVVLSSPTPCWGEDWWSPPGSGTPQSASVLLYCLTLLSLFNFLGVSLSKAGLQQITLRLKYYFWPVNALSQALLFIKDVALLHFSALALTPLLFLLKQFCSIQKIKNKGTLI